jgi:histidine triad (HIT) family protein
MSDCIFCKIIKGEIPCFKVFEDDNVLAFADINPISRGIFSLFPNGILKTCGKPPKRNWLL